MYIAVDDVIKVWTGTTTPAPLDIETSIAWISEFIDRTTRQWFESRTLTVYLDGNGSDTLLLPVPVISVTSLHINGDFDSALTTDDYFVYSSKGLKDERRNPRIRLAEEVFAAGRQNTKIVGAFGFVDAAGSPAVYTTPPGIRRACLKMVLHDLQNPIGGGSVGGGAPARAAGPVLMETVDRHQVMYSAPRMGTVRAGTFAVTGDTEVDAILASYRAPLLIGASSPLSAPALE